MKSKLLLAAALLLAPIAAFAQTSPLQLNNSGCGQGAFPVKVGSGWGCTTAPAYNGHQVIVGGTPVLTSCGTAPAIYGSDQAGQVTMGTGTPTGCVITFKKPYLTAPLCTVSWQAELASMEYTVTNTAITLVQTATDSNLVNYVCFARRGG